MNYSFKEFQRKSLHRLLGMDKYERIMQMMNDSKDLSTDKEFIKTFNAFYRVRRDKKWQDSFYKFFQENRNNKNLTFDEIIDYMFDETGNVEASFCSKMLATINPNMPIWDQYIIKNLKIKVEGNEKLERKESVKKAYRDIINEMNERLKRDDVKIAIKEFREFFPNTYFSDMKILDYLIWNER